jgi:hypothetical protein
VWHWTIMLYTALTPWSDATKYWILHLHPSIDILRIKTAYFFNQEGAGLFPVAYTAADLVPLMRTRQPHAPQFSIDPARGPIPVQLIYNFQPIRLLTAGGLPSRFSLFVYFYNYFSSFQIFLCALNFYSLYFILFSNFIVFFI